MKEQTIYDDSYIDFIEPFKEDCIDNTYDDYPYTGYSDNDIYDGYTDNDIYGIYDGYSEF